MTDNFHRLLDAVKTNTIGKVKDLLPYVDTAYNNSELLFTAAREGYLDIVKLLAPLSKPHKGYESVLVEAAVRGHLDVIEFLLPISNLDHDNLQDKKLFPLFFAAAYGHVSVLRLLLPFFEDNQVMINSSLAGAAERGQRDALLFLLPLSDPKANFSNVLFKAAQSDQFEMIDLLYPVSSGEDVLRMYKDWTKNKTTVDPSAGMEYLSTLVRMARDKAFLQDNISLDKPRRATKKI